MVRRKMGLVLLVASLFALFAVSCNKKSGSNVSSGKGEERTVKFYFIGPLTGDYANYGTYCRDAVEYAIEEFNRSEAAHARFSVQLEALDSAGDQNKALAQAEKAAADKSALGILGPVLTGETFSVAGMCQNVGITVMSPSATHKDITDTGDYIFRTVISDGLQGEVAGAYFAQELKYKKLAVLYTMNDYSKGLYEGMKKSFESNPGCQVVMTETCNIGDRDFRTQLTRLKSSTAEAIYIPNYTEEMAQILEQASQLGIKKPFLSGDGFSNPIIYDNAGAYTDGVVYVAPPQVKASTLYSAFVNAYSKKTGHAPDSFACNAYDAANIYIDAAERMLNRGENSREAFRKQVAATKDFAGVSGRINFAPNGDLIANQGVYKVNGKIPSFLGEYRVVNNKLQKAN